MKNKSGFVITVTTQSGLRYYLDIDFEITVYIKDSFFYKTKIEATKKIDLAKDKFSNAGYKNYSFGISMLKRSRDIK